jgi:hypothetical protein
MSILQAPGYEIVKETFEGYLPFEDKIEIDYLLPNFEEVK